MSFAGKTILITGATRGIGKAMGLRFAREGANIVIAAKSVEENPKLGGTIYTAAAEMEAAGGKALAVPCDIRFEDQIQNVIDKTVAKFGGIDILINNASAISLTKDGDYNDIRFSVATMDALDCHPDIMDKVYKAHHRFGNLLHDDKFQIKFRLEPGDIFSFNNRRILHGRTAFNPNSGNRHLQGYYMDRDEIIGRLNYLKKIKP